MTPDAMNQTDVDAQIGRIIESEGFRQSERLARFLTYIINAHFQGESDKLNQYLIGLEVFDRDETFDPVSDSIVRVEAGRLRSKLAEYYADEGKDDAIRVNLPKGGYAVSIIFLESDSPTDKHSQTTQTGIQLIWPGLALTVFVLVLAMTFALVEKSDVSHPEQQVNVTGAETNQKTATTEPVIAVLPFDDMSNQASQTYFTNGISEDIITDLSKISGVAVLARHSSFAFRGSDMSIREIGDALGAQYILEGSVRREGTTLRINAQLIDTDNELHLWAERYDRDIQDVFAIQDDVTNRIVQALQIELSGQEAFRIAQLPTDDPLALDLFLRAKERFYQFDKDAVDEAIGLFSKAARQDTDYAEALAWKSRALTYSYIAGYNTDPANLDAAKTNAEQSLSINPELAAGHAYLAWALTIAGEHEKAITAADIAVQLAPGDADNHLWRSMAYVWAGDGETALSAIDRGISLNPYHSVTYLHAKGRALLLLGEYDSALAFFERANDRNPKFTHAFFYRLLVLEALQRDDEAQKLANQIRKLHPQFQDSYSYANYRSHSSKQTLSADLSSEFENIR